MVKCFEFDAKDFGVDLLSWLLMFHVSLNVPIKSSVIIRVDYFTLGIICEMWETSNVSL